MKPNCRPVSLNLASNTDGKQRFRIQTSWRPARLNKRKCANHPAFGAALTTEVGKRRRAAPTLRPKPGGSWPAVRSIPRACWRWPSASAGARETDQGSEDAGDGALQRGKGVSHWVGPCVNGRVACGGPSKAGLTNGWPCAESTRPELAFRESNMDGNKTHSQCEESG